MKAVKGKVIIFSAPSGAGKTSIVKYLLERNPNLMFSVSATSRAPRGTEQHGKDYFFLSADEFRQRIAADEFVEYEEVYQDCFYGTLKEQVEKPLREGRSVVFDVDVIGAGNLKKYYGDEALSVFVKPPSVEALRARLTGRGTDSAETIEKRIAKAEYELSFATAADKIIVNNELEQARAEALRLIEEFI